MEELWGILDVGIVNLGLVALRVINRDEWTVVHMERVDITKLPPFPGEKHRRSREIADRMERFFYNYGPAWLEPSDRIYVERQPPTGLGHVEQLIFARFRDKCMLVSPRSLHRFLWFGPSVDYDERKRRNTITSTSIMREHSSPEMFATWCQWVETEQRVHDIADCLCIAKKETSSLPPPKIVISPDGRTLIELFGYKGERSKQTPKNSNNKTEVIESKYFSDT
jgi:hypothetical protein